MSVELGDGVACYLAQGENLIFSWLSCCTHCWHVAAPRLPLVAIRRTLGRPKTLPAPTIALRCSSRVRWAAPCRAAWQRAIHTKNYRAAEIPICWRALRPWWALACPTMASIATWQTLWHADVNHTWIWERLGLQAECLAAAKCGCDAIKSCIGWEVTSADAGGCQACSGSVYTLCGTGTSRGLRLTMDCTAIGLTCDPLAGCYRRTGNGLHDRYLRPRLRRPADGQRIAKTILARGGFSRPRVHQNSASRA